MKNKVSVALGTFDGLHKGHMAVLRKALSESAEIKTVITFQTPPKFPKSKAGLLMSADKKISVLKEMGFDEVILMDFDKVKDTEPEQFLGNIFSKMNVASITCGFNHRFGKGGKGDTKLLKEYCENNKANLNVCPPVEYEEKPISSTRIREELATGNIEKANLMLGYDYFIEAEIVHGDERGRTLGFPTINQNLPESSALLKFGVYETETEVEGKIYKSISNFGIRPSFEVDKPFVETHILGFGGEIYDKKVTVSFKRFIRGEEKFSSLSELKTAIKNDIEKILE